ncbi:hypothetical protein Csa_013782 [Cucumis sativus]|nr:hypothetical protein Csa_013782 [Cucumis sativus]
MFSIFTTLIVEGQTLYSPIEEYGDEEKLLLVKGSCKIQRLTFDHFGEAFSWSYCLKFLHLLQRFYHSPTRGSQSELEDICIVEVNICYDCCRAPMILPKIENLHMDAEM